MYSSRAMYAAVTIGSAIGALIRHGVTTAGVHLGALAFPLATLGVNVGGSFLIGFFATLSGPGGRVSVSPFGRQLVMAGLCGGLTTFSIFSLETIALVEDGMALAGALNVALGLLLWVPSAWAGHALAQRFGSARPDPMISLPDAG